MNGVDRVTDDRARVLIVDDDALVASLMKTGLENAEYDVDICAGPYDDSRSVAEHARSFRPHVVLMDLRLIDESDPGDIRGLELLKTGDFQSARSVLYSAHLEEDFRISVAALKEAGVDSVVLKDDPAEIIATVNAAATRACVSRRQFDVEWPAPLDSAGVSTLLFGPHARVPSSVARDVLGLLFRGAGRLRLQTLAGSAASPILGGGMRSIVLRAWADDREPVLVKLAPRKRAAREVAAYERYIDGRLGGHHHPRLNGSAIFWDIGAISYSLIGSTAQAQTFTACYHGNDDAEIIAAPLAQLFRDVWSRHYQQAVQPMPETTVAAYDRVLDIREKLRAAGASRQLECPGLPRPYPDPVAWLAQHESESSIPGARLCVVHGDLHGANLLVEDRRAWPVDFEHTGPGPILLDFVRLETDIVTHIVQWPAQDWPLFASTVELLTSAESLSVPLSASETIEASAELKKAFQVINRMRALAWEVTRCADIREYYWGLLLVALVTSAHEPGDILRCQRCLLFASILCERLQPCPT